MHVIVVGAGLGGLALTVALGEAGIDVAVLEQAEAFGEVGAGIQLSPNGMRALAVLGLADAVRAIGCEPRAATVRDHHSGRLLLRNAMGADAEARWGAPYLQAHRADLHALLLEAARGTGRVDFRLGSRVVGLEDGGVRLEEGARIAADAVIGCDGLRSMVRTALWGEKPARFTGQVAWRGTVSADGLAPELTEPLAQVWTGRHSHFVHYPVRGGALINFVAVTEERDWRIESWSERGDPARLIQTFADWPDPVRTLIAASDAIWRWALFDRPPLARWGRGDATLLGDAAHPMPPFLAQGASMAIEDAVMLARCLSGGQDIPIALARYEGARRRRTAKVQAWSRRNAVLFHLPSPVAAGVFAAASALDRVTPGGGAARFDWLYGYDAASSPL